MEKLSQFSPQTLSGLLTEINTKLKENSLEDYDPYIKQEDFHTAGRLFRERLFMAGNQQGKTFSGGAESAMHLTGRYPDWWDGKVFDVQVAGWAGGITGETTRDTVQRILMGRPNNIGTGAIPKDAIVEYTSRRGVADAIDTVVVRHGGGGDIQAGQSTLGFKSYDQGSAKWQGETLHFVWCDEEPPEDIYTEGLTRTNTTGGIIFVTFTPLQGMSKVVMKFLVEKSPYRNVTTMTINDVDHYSEEQKAAIIASYPAHERAARSNGIPTLGSGAIFPIDAELLKETSFAIPKHWPRIAGMDFGWDHPTAVAWIAWDRDTDTVHVYDVYRLSQATPIIHAATITAKGKWIPMAWPHDGEQHDKGSGEALATQYRKLQVNMLADKATHPPAVGEKEGTGGNSVEAGLMDMLQRMQTGRFKVARHLEDFFQEFLLYHRKDGKVVKEMDDIISAVRYAIMMLRHAKVQQLPTQVHTAPFKPLDASMGALG